MQTELHPIAVTMARALLFAIGVVALALPAALHFYNLEIPVWAWLVCACIGVFSLVSAMMESASAVLASVLVFFSPFG